MRRGERHVLHRLDYSRLFRRIEYWVCCYGMFGDHLWGDDTFEEEEDLEGCRWVCGTSWYVAPSVVLRDSVLVN